MIVSELFAAAAIDAELGAGGGKPRSVGELSEGSELLIVSGTRAGEAAATAAELEAVTGRAGGNPGSSEPGTFGPESGGKPGSGGDVRERAGSRAAATGAAVRTGGTPAGAVDAAGASPAPGSPHASSTSDWYSSAIFLSPWAGARKSVKDDDRACMRAHALNQSRHERNAR